MAATSSTWTGAGRERAREAYDDESVRGPGAGPARAVPPLGRAAVDQPHAGQQADRGAKGSPRLVLERRPDRSARSGHQLRPSRCSSMATRATARPPSPRPSRSMLGGDLFIPYAIEVDGQVIVIYDPVYHQRSRSRAGGAGPGGAREALGAAAAALRPRGMRRSSGRWCRPAASSRWTSSTCSTTSTQDVPGAVPDEGERRRAHRGRLRPPARAAARSAQPVDRAARKAGRLS